MVNSASPINLTCTGLWEEAGVSEEPTQTVKEQRSPLLSGAHFTGKNNKERKLYILTEYVTTLGLFFNNQSLHTDGPDLIYPHCYQHCKKSVIFMVRFCHLYAVSIF